MKTRTFRTKEQRKAIVMAMRLVAYAGGSIIGGKNQQAYNETIEAQKWLQIALGLSKKEDYFPKKELPAKKVA